MGWLEVGDGHRDRAAGPPCERIPGLNLQLRWTRAVHAVHRGAQGGLGRPVARGGPRPGQVQIRQQVIRGKGQGCLGGHRSLSSGLLDTGVPAPNRLSLESRMEQGHHRWVLWRYRSMTHMPQVLNSGTSKAIMSASSDVGTS